MDTQTSRTPDRRYAPPTFPEPITLDLSRNEFPWPNETLATVVTEVGQGEICQYPDGAALEAILASKYGIAPKRVVVTAGGDDAIERIIASVQADSRRAMLGHSPTFEMFSVYAERHGAPLRTIPWLTAEFPSEEFKAAISEDLAMLLLVTPNNPTGSVIPRERIIEVARAAQERDVPALVDLAYVEFADDDPTSSLLDLPNVFLVRSLSKAIGLAGLRVGYAIAPNAAAADKLRALGRPFAVSGASLRMAEVLLKSRQAELRARLAWCRACRDSLTELIESAGGKALPSQGNFVLARFPNAEATWLSLAQRGIAVRKFPSDDQLQGFLRLTCPPDTGSLARLSAALSGDSVSPADRARSGTIAAVARNGRCQAEISRTTKETDVQVSVTLRGAGRSKVSTGLGFLDHMLTALACHSRIDLDLTCRGDLEVDDHHTVEDCALALGQAIDDALGDRAGIARFGSAHAPLDEALARVVVDLSGRPSACVALGLQRERLGDVACESLSHFFCSLAMSARCALHVDVLRGDNDHHKAEAAFKALALALRQAFAPSGSGVPSTKGALA